MDAFGTPIIVSALGRVAEIGEFYDARSDTFLDTLVTKSSPTSKIIHSTDNNFTNISFLELNSIEEKFNTLDVHAELKLSALSGMIELSGSGKFVNDRKRSTKSAKITLANLMTTKFEKIDFTGDEERKLIDLDKLGKIDATHVVVGIQWGGKVLVSVEDYNEDNEDKETVQGSLGVTLRSLIGSISGEVIVDSDTKNKISKFSFEIYGDVLPTKMPATLLDAVALMVESPTLLMAGNAGKGKAMYYTLLPVTVYRDLFNVETKLNALVNSIDESTINSCVKLFAELNDNNEKINDLVLYQKRFVKFITKESSNKIASFANSYDTYLSTFRSKLSKVLVNVRAGTEAISTLDDIMEEAYKDKLSPKKINFEEYDSIKDEFAFLNLLVNLGCKILDHETTFQEFMALNWDKNIYTFFYTDEFPASSDESMIIFRNILHRRDTFDSKGIFVAIKASVLRENEHQIYFNFTGSTRLRVYQDDICVVDNYTDASNVKPIDNSGIWSYEYMQKQVADLIKNPVPIGFVYVQFHDMPKPEKLWPTAKWQRMTETGHDAMVLSYIPNTGGVVYQFDPVKLCFTVVQEKYGPFVPTIVKMDIFIRIE